MQKIPQWVNGRANYQCKLRKMTKHIAFNIRLKTIKKKGMKDW
jgi:hypothetical protein